MRIIWNEKQKLVKFNIPTALCGSDCIGEEAYGREKLKDGFEENVSQKYIAVCNPESALLCVNNGVYGSSFDKGELKITLLRSPSYCAHPIGGRETMPNDRYLPHIEQGERDFSFLIKAGSRDSILDSAARTAQEFGTQPMLLSFYPPENGKKNEPPVLIKNNEAITLNAFKKQENGNGYIIRLFNSTDRPQSCLLNVCGEEENISFGIFEIKTLKYDDGKITETDLTEGLLN